MEVARDNGWFDRGVFGLVNVGGKRLPEEQRLYLLRFPLHHDATIRREAARQGIDPAWVAAEIRAESVFDPKARSSADARGLMQVVPATAAEVAARLGLPWTGGNDLYDADTNIAIGTAPAPADGPLRRQAPRSSPATTPAPPRSAAGWQRADMDPDLWIETISYKETREYVARVLSFSTLYDWRLQTRRARVRPHARDRRWPAQGLLPARPPTPRPPQPRPSPPSPACASCRRR